MTVGSETGAARFQVSGANPFYAGSGETHFNRTPCSMWIPPLRVFLAVKASVKAVNYLEPEPDSLEIPQRLKLCSAS